MKEKSECLQNYFASSVVGVTITKNGCREVTAGIKFAFVSSTIL